MIVSSRDNKQCMVHQCSTCQDGSALIKFLEQCLKKEEPSLISDDNDEQNETEEEETIALDESMDCSR